MSSTSLALGTATHGGSLDGMALAIHAPAVAGGVPALHWLVAALLVTLGLVWTNLAGSGCCLHLAFGLDGSGWAENIQTFILVLFTS